MYQTEIFTRQDPYMVIWTTSTSDPSLVQRTKVHYDGGNQAQWDEMFRVNIEDFDTEHFFIEVRDKNDIFSDRLIGKAKFACSDIGSAPVEAWIKIYRDCGMDAGEVLIKAHIE